MNENETDLIESYAKQVPVITIARLLGIPEEMSDQLLKWSNTMVAVYQADISEETKSLAYAQAITQTKLLSLGAEDLLKEEEEINGKGG